MVYVPFKYLVAKPSMNGYSTHTCVSGGEPRFGQSLQHRHVGVLSGLFALFDVFLAETSSASSMMRRLEVSYISY